MCNFAPLKNLGKVYKHPFEKSRKGDLWDGKSMINYWNGSTNYTLTSIKKCIEKYRNYLSTPYVLHSKDVEVKDGLVFLPLYMTPLLWLPRFTSPFHHHTLHNDEQYRLKWFLCHSFTVLYYFLPKSMAIAMPETQIIKKPTKYKNGILQKV